MITDNLNELRELFKKAMEENEHREEQTWESLDYDTQLDVFCYVCRKLYQGEIVDGHSYRGMLYDVFGFDMDAYGRAQCAGFLDLHNSIVSKDELKNVVSKFAEKHSVNVSDADISKFIDRHEYL